MCIKAKICTVIIITTTYQTPTCPVLSQDKVFRGGWEDGGGDEATGVWPWFCSRGPPIRMRVSAEALYLQGQKGYRNAGSRPIYLIKDRECSCEFFVSADVSPNYNWATGQHKIKLLEPVRPD